MQHMKAALYLSIIFVTIVIGQTRPPMHNFEIGAAGVFPLSGFRTYDYEAGPGWRAGYEFRPAKHFAADAGFTQTWPITAENCGRFGCEYAREKLGLLDYGVRGILPVAQGRLELSVGIGGAYVWHPFGYSGPFGSDGALLQYSGKASFALSQQGRVRANVSVRGYRDLGRPTQQWLATTVGVSCGF